MPEAEDDLGRELLDAYRVAVAAARAAGARPVLIGGLAAGLRGRHRFTDDVDLILEADEARYPRVLDELAARGIALPAGALDRLRRDGLLTVNVGTVRVDLLVTADELSAEVAREAPDEVIFVVPVGVARPEHLIVMKLIPRRPQDIMDIQAMLVRNRGALDLAIIERWLPEIDFFAPGASELFAKLKLEFHD